MYLRRTVREITDDTIWIQAEKVPSMDFNVDELCWYRMVPENTLLIHPGVVPAFPFPSTVVAARWRGWREGWREGVAAGGIEDNRNGGRGRHPFALRTTTFGGSKAGITSPRMLGENFLLVVKLSNMALDGAIATAERECTGNSGKLSNYLHRF